jgi:glyoxylase-like metal-dependent hydrolase (beta-lactamase superfamily II)
MEVSERFHALKINFKIPISPDKTIDRFVYVYLVFGDKITLIDSGVLGSDSLIFDYFKKAGRDPKEISTLILSHSHPDHLGGARAIREFTGCVVYAHEAEKHWIEDTERQREERPVPGFSTLVGGPVSVDRLLADGQILTLAEKMPCRVIHTPGHSPGSIALYFEKERLLFSGDAVPLPGDLPIYENLADCVSSIHKLKNLGKVETLCSSWEDPVKGAETIARRCDQALAYLQKIHESVLRARKQEDLLELCRQVIGELGLPPFAANPLTARALASSLALGDKPPFFQN